MLNATFCSHRDWEYPDPHLTQRSREQPQSSYRWPAHIYQLNLYDALLSPSALFLLCGLTLGLNLLASQPRGAGKDMKCNSACCSFLTSADHLHPCTLSPHFGAHSHSVLLYVGGSWPWQTQKTSQKGHFHQNSPEFIQNVLSKPGSRNYLQTSC